METILPQLKTDPVSFVGLIYVVAVTAIAILPRMPDDEPCSIGGKLSRGFRNLLMVIASIDIMRKIFVTHTPEVLDKAMVVTESSLISLLSLLMAFLVRVWMSERINFQGARQCGKGLMPWVYLIMTLSLSGNILASMFEDQRTINHYFWIIKKIAEALSFIPVDQTLQMLSKAMPAAPRSKRGSVLVQMVYVGEYYALLAHITDICCRLYIVFNIADGTKTAIHTEWTLSMNNHFAIFTRILCHSVFLNLLDETHHLNDYLPIIDKKSSDKEAGDSKHHGQDGKESAALVTTASS